MKSKKVESDLEHQSIEKEYDHTQSERGKSISSNKKNFHIIYSYKMKWETDV